MEKQEQLVPNPRRNILRMAVANILTETGFGKADKQCVESLTEVRAYHTLCNIDILIENLCRFFLPPDGAEP